MWSWSRWLTGVLGAPRLWLVCRGLRMGGFSLPNAGPIAAAAKPDCAGARNPAPA